MTERSGGNVDPFAMKYDEPEAGEWVRPVKRGYKMACCECGLVHRIDFDHIPWGRGRRVIFRVFRDNRATAAVRRWMKRKSNAEHDTRRD
jgi:hypothetical protein